MNVNLLISIPLRITDAIVVYVCNKCVVIFMMTAGTDRCGCALAILHMNCIRIYANNVGENGHRAQSTESIWQTQSEQKKPHTNELNWIYKVNFTYKILCFGLSFSFRFRPYDTSYTHMSYVSYIS